MQRKFRKLVGARVLVTGHTGFTGSWVAFWLERLGASVAGLALAPDTTPSLYRELGLQAIESHEVDIRDFDQVADVVERVQPELVLHLAAQPLVRRSYEEPLATFATNAIGTAHVLEACRWQKSVRAIVCVTTDKVYENREWDYRYRENDPLGGKDPYSASKAAAELVVASYRASFLSRSNVAIAAARGGNIIGGGDWSADRLVPDFVRAVTSLSSLRVRYANATRPWQHVLALIDGYFTLLEALLESPESAARAWNFGPVDPKVYPVRAVLDLLSESWSRPDIVYETTALPEAQSLQLDSSLAVNRLGWTPHWDTRASILATADWYRRFHEGSVPARQLCAEQIDAWMAYEVAV